MHEDILSPEQVKLLPLINNFSENFGLIGGTAIALQLGHRRSIDFDLVTFTKLNANHIKGIIRENHSLDSTLVDEENELTLAVDGIKVTFLKYPFVVPLTDIAFKNTKMPPLLSLAAMKAFALGRRAKWKDYVDLYFIFKTYSLKDLCKITKQIFSEEFNEKLLREQLAYFKDIDYSEQIEYMDGYETSDEIIKRRLVEFSLQK